jgi:hypothetical protein
MELVIKSRLAITEEKLGEISLPRIVRVARKLKWSEDETKIGTYVLAKQCGYDRLNVRNYSFGSDVIDIPYALGISVADMLEFLSEERAHMEQGFFPDIQQGYIMNNNVTYDSGFCKAMTGAHLKSEELLKLEQTVLADVIAEEPGCGHLR